MKHNLSHGVSGIPNREPFEQFTAARFGLLPRQQSLAYDLEFDHAECPFDAQHQLIVEIIQIVDLLLVSDKRSKDPDTPPAADTSLCRCGIAAIIPGCRRFRPPPVPPS